MAAAAAGRWLPRAGRVSPKPDTGSYHALGWGGGPSGRRRGGLAIGKKGAELRKKMKDSSEDEGCPFNAHPTSQKFVCQKTIEYSGGQ